jgi:hypothetical protein
LFQKSKMADAKKLYSNIDFFLKSNETLDQIKDQHQLAFKYMYHLNKGSKILNDQKALNALNYIIHYSWRNNQLSNDIIETSLKYEFPKIIVSIIDNIYQRLIECYYFEGIDDETKIGSLGICLLSLTILDNFCQKEEFCVEIQRERSLRTLFSILNNRTIQEVIADLIEYNRLRTKEYVLLRGVYKLIISSLFSMSRFYHSFKFEWQECNSVKNLLFFISKSKQIFDVRNNLALIIGNVFNENDFEKFSSVLDTVIIFLILLVAES